MKKKLIFLSALVAFTLTGCNNNTKNTNTKETKITESNSKTEEENNTLKAQIKELEEENERIKKQNEELESANANLKDENDTLNALNDEFTSVNEGLIEQVEKLEEENAQVKSIKKQYLKNNNLFEITYVDYLGNATTKFNKVDDFEKVTDALIDLNVGAVFQQSNYGTYIKSANNAINDYNWALNIYENYVSSLVGIDGLEINAGDVFEIKDECWNIKTTEYGEFDKYDVLVDKVLYNYFNNRFKNTLSTTKSFKGSTYWENQVLYKLINAKSNYGYALYDTSFFNSDLLNDELVSEINSYDISKLSGTEFFKYYYAKRLISEDFADFKLKYEDYIKSFETYGQFGEYTIPFVASTAKTLGLIDSLSSSVKESTYIPDASQWGPDGISWLLTGKASYKTLTDDDFKLLSFDLLENSSSKDVSLSSMILPYAATNKNVRDLKNSDGVDVIKFLFDNYFDLDTMKFSTEASASDYSSNQIYAALVAYKIQRDTKQACNLFE